MVGHKVLLFLPAVAKAPIHLFIPRRRTGEKKQLLLPGPLSVKMHLP